MTALNGNRKRVALRMARGKLGRGWRKIWIPSERLISTNSRIFKSWILFKLSERTPKTGSKLHEAVHLQKLCWNLQRTSWYTSKQLQNDYKTPKNACKNGPNMIQKWPKTCWKRHRDDAKTVPKAIPEGYMITPRWPKMTQKWPQKLQHQPWSSSSHMLGMCSITFDAGHLHCTSKKI